MNKEEKKAIHDLKILRMGIGLLNCIPGIEKDEVDIKAIDCVLNLVDKQQKEIEKLKSKKYIFNAETNEIKEIPISDDYISKDTIKEKILECENKIKKIRNKKLINEPEDTIIITRYAHYISVLQPLLSKENNI